VRCGYGLRECVAEVVCERGHGDGRRRRRRRRRRLVAIIREGRDGVGMQRPGPVRWCGDRYPCLKCRFCLVPGGDYTVLGVFVTGTVHSGHLKGDNVIFCTVRGS
jgi:hypothetical protein